MAATSYSADPTLYLYTSLTAGSSHIITATSRLETILKANKIPFRAIDCATDEKARMLWGRRSKGRKLPGLVKYGTIIGDLEQIEEWNEYGELKEQIASTQDFGSLTTSTNLAPEPPAPSTSSTPQRSSPPSRASSETRHISISEPKDKEKEKDQESPAYESKQARSPKPTESPMNLAIRQLGAEAAAVAGQKRATAAQAAKAATAAPVKEPSASDKTPVPAVTRLSADAAAESPDTATEVTATKTPAQLAAEGAKRTSVDKIEESKSGAASGINEDSTSTEEQLLALRRTSSIAKAKTPLSETTPIEESETVLEDSTTAPEPEKSSAVSPSEGKSPLQHRGSDIGEARPEDIGAGKKKLGIREEKNEDDEDEGEEEKDRVVTSTDKVEEEVTKGTDTQKTGANDADKAGVSVGD
ncbi:uncharacterized protein Z518_07686 [Rhinocladiella mackenziei CBS 650.93]|uniref:Glutaredoxin domain-containing protein n=1 Tax=Rhinocladiella mackenziei CBS 650.93 TaxID=1442369 RepID=A0A0D2H107_9EURO|nr:uncharacterized protein Z518_07686 [Rhinocladiella mackenziei CBS 650.93]KIX04133.1 hypothetical protein Z518_07686 [Rhinocladiella mackenziei CBS 650.93]